MEHSISRKYISLMLTVVCVFSAVMTTTLAWQDVQHKSNEFSGMHLPERSAVLEKLDKETEAALAGIHFDLYRVDDGEEDVLIGHYTTGEDGKIVVDRLAPGDYYWLETAPIYGWTYDKDNSGNEIKKYPFTIEAGGQDPPVPTKVTAYNQRLYADLTITKTVVHPVGGEAEGAGARSSRAPLSEGADDPDEPDGTAPPADGDADPLDPQDSPVTDGREPAEVNRGLLDLFDAVVSGGGLGAASVGPGQDGAENGGSDPADKNGEVGVSPGLDGAASGEEEAAGNTAESVASGPADNQSKAASSGAISALGAPVEPPRTPGEGGTATEPETGEGGTAPAPETGGPVEGEDPKEGETDPTTPDPTTPDPVTTPDPTTPDPVTTPDPTTPDPTTPDPATEGPALQALGADPGLIFEFTVTFIDIEDGPVTVLIDGTESQKTITDGKLVIELKDGQTAVIKGLPVGTEYTVVEKPVTGYIVTGDNHHGIIPPEGITASFINTYYDEGPDKLIVKKTVTGEGADLEKEFGFVVTINGEETRFTLKHGEQKEFTLPPGASYQVKEDNYLDDGYFPSTRFSSYIDDEGLRVVEYLQTNRFTGPVLIDIEGEKTWDLSGQNVSLPANITVYLKDGNTVVRTLVVTPDADGRWYYKFEGVPKYRANGVTLVVYTVEEAPITGFTPTVTGYNIVNKYEPAPELIDIGGEKTWDLSGQDVTLPASITVNLKDGNTIVRTVVVTPGQDGKWRYVFEGLPKYRADGTTLIVYTVEEVPIPGFTPTVTGYNIVNKYVPTTELIDIGGEKTWDLSGQDITLPTSITVNLKDGNTIVRTVVVTPGQDGKWRYTFEGLPKYRADGVTLIVYTVEEEPIPGFTYSVNGYNIINKYVPPGASVTPLVKKTVTGNPANNAVFQFRLTALDGAPMPQGSSGGSKTISITGAGEANFGQIDFAAAGTYKYNISEIQESITGWVYDTTVYTLTVSVTLQGGVLSAASTLTKADGAAAGSGKAEFTNNYNKPDEPGPGGPGEPGKPGEPGQPERPVTGDESNIWLWALLLIVSALALRFLALYPSPAKRTKQ